MLIGGLTAAKAVGGADIGVIPELIDGETGHLAAPDDPLVWRDALG